MPNALRLQTPGYMNDRDALHRIVSPQGRVESYTEYNHEITGHSSGDALPDDLRAEFRYGGNAYWLGMELERRGFRIDDVRD